MRQTSTLCLLLMMPVLALSCSSVHAAPVLTGRPITTLESAYGTVYGDAVWVGPHRLVVTQLVGEKMRPRLGVLNTQSAAFTLLPTKERAGCESTGSSFPVLLGAKSIAYLSTCFGGSGVPDNINEIRRLNLDSLVDSRLFPYSVLPFAGRFTFAPSEKRGLLNNGYGLREQLQWLFPNRIETVKIPSIARAGMPSWEPGGRRIVFDGVPRGVGGDLSAAPRDLYVAEPEFLSAPRVLERRITGVAGTGVTWVPGHPWVIFPMRPDGGPSGLWLIDVESGKRVLLRTGTGFGKPTVSKAGVVALPVRVDALGGGSRHNGAVVLFQLNIRSVAARVARDG